MKRSKFFFTALAAVLAFVVGIAMASGISAAFANNNATTTTNATATTDINTGKIYMMTLTVGVIMSPEQEADLLAKAETSEWSNSKFTQLAKTGKEVVDTKTGITFVIPSYSERPNFADGITRIYDIAGVPLEDLATDKKTMDEFAPCEEVVTSFGTFTIYR